MPAVDAGRSAVHSCRGAGASEPPGRLTRRSFSDSFHSVTARTAGWLRRAAVVSLLGLPLLFGLATEAVAQDMPTISVEFPTLAEGESGVIRFTLSETSTQTITVRTGLFAASFDCASTIGFSCPEGTSVATFGDDYSFPLFGGTVTFPPGETTRTISVTTIADGLAEGTEVFPWIVIPPSSHIIDPMIPADATVAGQLIWFGYILDTSAMMTTAATPSIINEGDTAAYAVSLSSPPDSNVEVTVASGDTAIATVAPATLAFTTENWHEPQEVTVTGVSDGVNDEANRTVNITHTISSGDSGG